MTLAILLLGLGLAFIVAEVLFTSLGLLALLATACIVGSVASAFAISPEMGIRFLVAIAVLVPSVIVLGLKLFPHTPMGKYLVNPGLSFGAKPSFDDRDLSLVGHSGVAEAQLRPAGIARIDGRRVDVVSRGEMIAAGEPVRVIEVVGNRVVVARLEDPARETSPPPA
jgi:membrane-bound ClpP family serine protease